MNKWALSLYIHYKNKGVMVAHLVSHSHRFKLSFTEIIVRI